MNYIENKEIENEELINTLKAVSTYLRERSPLTP